MWILEHTSVVNAEAEGQFLLLPGKYVVGRLSCDIQCQHASISRKHTELAIGQPEHDSKDSSLSISGILRLCRALEARMPKFTDENHSGPQVQ